MATCKLKKGDRIYECRYREATLTELITDPELCVQEGDSHYWHWKAKVVETNSHNVAPGEIVEFGITEEAPHYGPRLYRKNVYEVGFENAEPILPPFDTSVNEMAGETAEDADFITELISLLPMTDEEMATRMREAGEIAKQECKTSCEDNEVMNDLEKKALEFIAKTEYIVQDKSQEKIDSLFNVLDSLSLPAGFCLGLKLAEKVGIGDESWFYTYQGKDPIDTFSCRVPDRSTLFKDIIVEPTVMGAWQAYLLYMAPTILPTFWHGGYIAREYFFDRANYKGITTNWARGNVDVKLSLIPRPSVVMKDGMAVVSCPYWNNWRGLVLESVEVSFNADGTVTLTPHAKVLYEYNCGICY